MTRLIWVSLLLVLVGADLAQAATRVWPGAVLPCAGSLQACIDGSAAGDTVWVAQNAPITEALRVDKPLQLMAAEGYRPVIAAGLGIAGTVAAAGSWVWRVEGFALQQGAIAITAVDGSAASVVIRNNRIAQAVDGASEIQVLANLAVGAPLNYDISYNQLQHDWNGAGGVVRAAIEVENAGDGSSSGRIRENHVVASGAGSIGILVDSQRRNHRSEVLGNWVSGGSAGSIRLRHGDPGGASAGTLTGFVVNNVVRSQVPGSGSADGIRVEIFSGTAQLTVWHNTVVDAVNGLQVLANPGATASGDIRGNLFAYLGAAGLVRVGSPALNDRDNLFFQTTETPATPGLSASSIFADPLLQAVPGDPHLRPGSAAIDRLNAIELREINYSEGLPFIDGDGLRRIKLPERVLPPGNVLDLGALEFGDASFVHTVSPWAPGMLRTVSHPALNGVTSALPQLLANWNPDGMGGVDSDHPVSWRYSDAFARWQMRNEDLLDFNIGAAFNIFVPAAGSGLFRHANTINNTSGSVSYLGNTELAGYPDAIVLAVRRSDYGNASDLAAPVAVEYADGAWRLRRLDGQPMPADGAFHVYYQEPSGNAFRHRASAGNTSGQASSLDHPLLNGHRCARFQVGQGLDLVGNNHQIGVAYGIGVSERWAIFNQDHTDLPIGALFHVVVDPSSVDCAEVLLADGFE